MLKYSKVSTESKILISDNRNLLLVIFLSVFCAPEAYRWHALTYVHVFCSSLHFPSEQAVNPRQLYSSIRLHVTDGEAKKFECVEGTILGAAQHILRIKMWNDLPTERIFYRSRGKWYVLSIYGTAGEAIYVGTSWQLHLRESIFKISMSGNQFGNSKCHMRALNGRYFSI